MFSPGQRFTTKQKPKRTAEVVQIGVDGIRARIRMCDEAGNLLADSWVDYRRFIHHWLPSAGALVGRSLLADMVDHSKRETRPQRVVELLAQPSVPVAWPLCHCGAPAKYEVNRTTSVEFVCRKHLPNDFG